MGALFAAVTTWDNLWLAYSKAARGKRRRGSAAAFEHQVADRLITLQGELRRKAYRPSAYRHFFIHEPKRRKISAAPFRDRVVHHALCNLIEPSATHGSASTATPIAPARVPTGRWIGSKPWRGAIVTCCARTWSSISHPWTMAS